MNSDVSGRGVRQHSSTDGYRDFLDSAPSASAAPRVRGARAITLAYQSLQQLTSEPPATKAASGSSAAGLMPQHASDWAGASTGDPATARQHSVGTWLSHQASPHGLEPPSAAAAESSPAVPQRSRSPFHMSSAAELGGSSGGRKYAERLYGGVKSSGYGHVAPASAGPAPRPPGRGSEARRSYGGGGGPALRLSSEFGAAGNPTAWESTCSFVKTFGQTRPSEGLQPGREPLLRSAHSTAAGPRRKASASARKAAGAKGSSTSPALPPKPTLLHIADEMFDARQLALLQTILSAGGSNPSAGEVATAVAAATQQQQQLGVRVPSCDLLPAAVAACGAGLPLSLEQAFGDVMSDAPHSGRPLAALAGHQAATVAPLSLPVASDTDFLLGGAASSAHGGGEASGGTDGGALDAAASAQPSRRRGSHKRASPASDARPTGSSKGHRRATKDASPSSPNLSYHQPDEEHLRHEAPGDSGGRRTLRASDVISDSDEPSAAAFSAFTAAAAAPAASEHPSSPLLFRCTSPASEEHSAAPPRPPADALYCGRPPAQPAARSSHLASGLAGAARSMPAGPPAAAPTAVIAMISSVPATAAAAAASMTAPRALDAPPRPPTADPSAYAPGRILRSATLLRVPAASLAQTGSSGGGGVPPATSHLPSLQSKPSKLWSWIPCVSAGKTSPPGGQQDDDGPGYLDPPPQLILGALPLSRLRSAAQSSAAQNMAAASPQSMPAAAAPSALPTTLADGGGGSPFSRAVSFDGTPIAAPPPPPALPAVAVVSALRSATDQLPSLPHINVAAPLDRPASPDIIPEDDVYPFDYPASQSLFSSPGSVVSSLPTQPSAEALAEEEYRIAESLHNLAGTRLAPATAAVTVLPPAAPPASAAAAAPRVLPSRSRRGTAERFPDSVLFHHRRTSDLNAPPQLLPSAGSGSIGCAAAAASTRPKRIATDGSSALASARPSADAPPLVATAATAAAGAAAAVAAATAELQRRSPAAGPSAAPSRAATAPSQQLLAGLPFSELLEQLHAALHVSPAAEAAAGLRPQAGGRTPLSIATATEGESASGSASLESDVAREASGGGEEPAAPRAEAQGDTKAAGAAAEEAAAVPQQRQLPPPLALTGGLGGGAMAAGQPAAALSPLTKGGRKRASGAALARGVAKAEGSAVKRAPLKAWQRGSGVRLATAKWRPGVETSPPPTPEAPATAGLFHKAGAAAPGGSPAKPGRDGPNVFNLPAAPGNVFNFADPQRVAAAAALAARSPRSLRALQLVRRSRGGAPAVGFAAMLAGRNAAKHHSQEPQQPVASQFALAGEDGVPQDSQSLSAAASAPLTEPWFNGLAGVSRRQLMGMAAGKADAVDAIAASKAVMAPAGGADFISAGPLGGLTWEAAGEAAWASGAGAVVISAHSLSQPGGAAAPEEAPLKGLPAESCFILCSHNSAAQDGSAVSSSPGGGASTGRGLRSDDEASNVASNGSGSFISSSVGFVGTSHWVAAVDAGAASGALAARAGAARDAQQAPLQVPEPVLEADSGVSAAATAINSPLLPLPPALQQQQQRQQALVAAAVAAATTGRRTSAPGALQVSESEDALYASASACLVTHRSSTSLPGGGSSTSSSPTGKTALLSPRQDASDLQIPALLLARTTKTPSGRSTIGSMMAGLLGKGPRSEPATVAVALASQASSPIARRPSLSPAEAARDSAAQSCLLELAQGRVVSPPSPPTGAIMPALCMALGLLRPAGSKRSTPSKSAASSVRQAPGSGGGAAAAAAAAAPASPPFHTMGTASSAPPAALPASPPSHRVQDTRGIDKILLRPSPPSPARRPATARGAPRAGAPAAGSPTSPLRPPSAPAFIRSALSARGGSLRDQSGMISARASASLRSSLVTQPSANLATLPSTSTGSGGGASGGTCHGNASPRPPTAAEDSNGGGGGDSSVAPAAPEAAPALSVAQHIEEVAVAAATTAILAAPAAMASTLPSAPDTGPVSARALRAALRTVACITPVPGSAVSSTGGGLEEGGPADGVVVGAGEQGEVGACSPPALVETPRVSPRECASRRMRDALETPAFSPLKVQTTRQLQSSLQEYERMVDSLQTFLEADERPPSAPYAASTSAGPTSGTVPSPLTGAAAATPGARPTWDDMVVTCDAAAMKLGGEDAAPTWPAGVAAAAAAAMDSSSGCSEEVLTDGSTLLPPPPQVRGLVAAAIASAEASAQSLSASAAGGSLLYGSGPTRLQRLASTARSGLPLAGGKKDAPAVAAGVRGEARFGWRPPMEPVGPAARPAQRRGTCDEVVLATAGRVDAEQHNGVRSASYGGGGRQ